MKKEDKESIWDIFDYNEFASPTLTTPGNILIYSVFLLCMIPLAIICLPFFLAWLLIKSICYGFHFVFTKKQYRIPYKEFMFMDEDEREKRSNARLRIFAKQIEPTALQQINTLMEQAAFKDSKVRIMPDVHAGKGCVIGFTADLGEKVIPNIVGVDIGCGMSWCELQGDIDLEKFDQTVKKFIPAGMNVRTSSLTTHINLKDLYCYSKLKNKEGYLERSLGTLGGGNHFIEIDRDEDGKHYLIVHTGSRNLGKQVCEIYQDIATNHCSYEKEMKEEREQAIKALKENGQQHLIQSTIDKIQEKYKDKLKMPKDLCYIEGEDRENYLHDMRICQKWASENRFNIINIVCSIMQIPHGEIIETIHNYIGDDNIVRKGAISAKKDEIVLIPMNMRDGCIIAKGKGNPSWNCSAPHGAGRLMSRKQARDTLSVVDFKNEMNGIYTTTADETTIDEAPMAYKPMEEIIDCIGDTADILKIIKPIYNFKASEEGEKYDKKSRN